jgi:hypothetical protein
MVMNKKFCLIFFLIFLCASVFAGGLSNYVVPDSVSLGQHITATGFYSDGNNPINNIKCSFYFLNDLNVVVERATDEYTTSSGRFVLTPFLITEPTFLRGQEYILKTECGTFTEEKTFVVGQRQTIAHLGSQEFEYITNPENVDTLSIWFLLGIAFFVLVLPAGALIYLMKRKG